MSLLDLHPQFRALLCGSCLIASNHAAAEDPPAKLMDLPRSIQVSLRQEEIVGSQQARRAYISCGTNEFVFTLAENSRMESATAERVVIGCADASYFVTFRILQTPLAVDALNDDAYRAILLKQFSSVTNFEASTINVAGRSGRAFEARWTQVGVSRLAKVSFVPTSAGVLEFGLQAKQEKNSEGMFAYNYILGSCLSNEKGKIVIVPLLDRS